MQKRPIKATTRWQVWVAIEVFSVAIEVFSIATEVFSVVTELSSSVSRH